MVVDAVRTYLEAASGFTELTRKHAVAAAKTLLRESDERSGGAITRVSDTARSTLENVESSVRGTRVGHSIQALAAELLETSRANRAAISGLVEGEVERFLDRLDLVRRDEHDRLVRRVAELERRLASAAAAQRRRAVEEAEAGAVPGAPTPAAPESAAESEGSSSPGAGRVVQPGAEGREPAGEAASAPGAGTRRAGARPRPAKGQAKRAAARRNPGPAQGGSK